MSFCSIVRDVREGFGSLSRRSFEVRSSRHQEGKSHGSVHELEDHAVAQSGYWASLPPELLCDVIKRLETSESTWPARQNVVVCASVCKAWREMCKEIVPNPEVSGKLTFPVSLKQPGPRDEMIQCFIMRDKSSLTYRLFLCLSLALRPENGKFLLSAKRIRRTTCTEYVISTDADSISRSSSKYIGKLRSNFMSTKFIIYDTQPPYNSRNAEHQGCSSRRFYSKKVSPKVSSGNYIIAQVAYEPNVVGNRGPRRMHCTMYSIPATSLDPGGVVPSQPELLSRSLENSFRSITFSKRIDSAAEFSSSRFSDISMMENEHDGKERPLILKNETPRWHDDFHCWCLNFRGRVTVASVKNFQLIAATTPPATTAPNAPSTFQSGSSNHEKVLMQFGKVCKDIFTMDYRYPLSAFQAFAICLSSFDTKLACK